MSVHFAKHDKAQRRAVAVTAAIALALAGAAACARPAADIDLSLNRTTENKLFRVSLASQTHPIPMSKVHRWSVHIATADGQPVTGARLEVDGGMPEHGHGLPTAPRAEAAVTPGDYVIQGMKFSMPGWWVLKLKVKAPNGRADQITFNIAL
jgi:hypothetical protein